MRGPNRRFHVWWLAWLVAASALLPSSDASAAVTADQRKQLGDLRRTLLRATPLLRGKDYDGARAIVDEVSVRLDELGFDKNEPDRMLRALRGQIRQVRSRLPVSFEHEVAPIVKDRCLNCHGDERARAGLRLDTFAGWRKGGQGGRLFAAGNANRSRIVARLAASGNERMPRQGQPLSGEQIRTIARWITQGAKYDGFDVTAMIGTTKPKGPPKPDAVIVMADGSESVSFSRDIAPFMVNICLRCHSGSDPRSGFSLETFEKLMQGGDSGVLVMGGDLRASRLWDLAGNQDPIKMPPGQALITEANHRNLRIWIEEGAKFDGEDPTATLQSIAIGAMPSPISTNSDEATDWPARRAEQAAEFWKKALPNDDSETVETDEFLIVGNTGRRRLDDIGKWAEDHAKLLKTMFGERARPIWKGRLIVFVSDDRFGYEEFHQVLLRRQAPRGASGHAVVSPEQSEAYVVVEDIGDESTSRAPDLKTNLIQQLSAAFLARSDSSLPDWLLLGTGLALAGQQNPRSSYIRTMPRSGARSLRSLREPADIFRSGVFSPSETGSVGFLLVRYLIASSGRNRFVQFVRRLQAGESVEQVIGAVYRSTPSKVAEAFLRSLPPL